MAPDVVSIGGGIGVSECEWSGLMESMRKDVERTLGSLKGRFRILKYGFRLNNKETVDNTVFTCMILHNMLLKWDNLDVWEISADYAGVDGALEQDILMSSIVEDREGGFARELQGDFSFCDELHVNTPELHEDHWTFCQKLITHHWYRRNHGGSGGVPEVHWPRRLLLELENK